MKILLQSASIFLVFRRCLLSHNHPRLLNINLSCMTRLHNQISNPVRSWTSNLFLLLFVFCCLSVGIGGCAGKSGQTQGEIQQAEVASQDIGKETTEKEDDLLDEPFVDPFEDPFDQNRGKTVEEYDPIEPVNSAIFEFNYRLDKYFLKPVAKVYNFFVPPDVQQSLANVFQNVRFVPRLFNNLFQGKFKGAGIEMSRFLVNSTLGVGGLFDPAGIMFDLNTPPEDLGQTLGTYGVPNGPYLVLPLLGPFTLRDGIGFLGDTLLDPFNWLVLPIAEVADAPRLVQHDSTIAISQLSLRVGNIINARALTLEKFQGVEEGTLDLYGAVRNAYYQQRLKAIKE